MITHRGIDIPVFPQRFDPDGVEWISIAWDEAVALYGAIATSEWVLETGWTSLSESQDVSVTDSNGNSYTHANRIQLSAIGVTGRQTITNRVAFGDGTILDRSVAVIVGNI